MSFDHLPHGLIELIQEALNRVNETIAVVIFPRKEAYLEIDNNLRISFTETKVCEFTYNSKVTKSPMTVIEVTSKVNDRKLTISFKVNSILVSCKYFWHGFDIDSTSIDDETVDDETAKKWHELLVSTKQNLRLE